MAEPADVLSPPVYLDASALVKLLVAEPESDSLNQALIGTEDVVVSDLALTETASALGRRTREGRLSHERSRRLYGEAQKVAGACRGAEITPPVHQRAERLLLTVSLVPLRTVDALHVALALEAGAATLVTYDPRLRDAASSQGLFVASPDEGRDGR
jgi:predicted nucleic acid-binding protein